MPDKVDPHLLDPPAGSDETAKAEGLRAALEDPRLANEEADLARALAAAWSPRDLPAVQHRALVDRALGRAGAARGRASWMQASLGASVVLALAASVCVVLWAERPPSRFAGRVSASSVAASRSTQSLFAERFARAGGETARIDRIALARAADFRDSEFARWGVR
jgi:hypothetical protein